MLEKTRSRPRHKIDKTMLEIGTNPRVEDAGHLKKIRELPCCNCYMSGHTEAAHFKYQSHAGIALKNDDWRVTPLCVNCHRMGPGNQGVLGEVRFWGKRLDKVEPFCMALYGASRDQMEILVYQFYRSGK